MLHYNFPSFSTGEVKRFGTPGRREIGHGALAQRAVEAVLPTKEEFPYTIRVVSDILESNGSSSMATVCGASMALMDAGAPLKAPGGGHRDGPGQGRRQGRHPHRHHGQRGPLRRHGLQGRRHREGHHRAADGHQDRRRVHRHHAPGAGPGQGGAAARAGQDGARPSRGPGPSSRPYAPRFVTIKIRPEKIREIIGPGGKVIRGIQEKTGRQDRRGGRRQGDRVLARAARRRRWRSA